MNIPSVLFGATIGILAGIVIAVLIDAFRYRNDMNLARSSPVANRPKERGKERLIVDMAVGETGYTVPWAFARLRNDSYYNLFVVQGNYPVLGDGSGTVDVLIKRTETGIETNINQIDIFLAADAYANLQMKWDWLQVFPAPEDPDLAAEDATVAEEVTAIDDNS